LVDGRTITKPSAHHLENRKRMITDEPEEHHVTGRPAARDDSDIIASIGNEVNVAGFRRVG